VVLADGAGGVKQVWSGTGALSIGPSYSNVGTTGQVLCSRGPGLPPAWANAGGSSLSVADVTSNSTYYPVFTDQPGGAAFSTATITSSKLTWNPGTGILTAVDVNTTSDLRQKTNIAEIANPLALLAQITGWSFDYQETGMGSFGVIAQELENVLPQLVGEHESGYKTVRYLPLIAVLIEAVKDLADEISLLKKSNK
jgi:hypothetical protein